MTRTYNGNENCNGIVVVVVVVVVVVYDNGDDGNDNNITNTTNLADEKEHANQRYTHRRILR